MPGIPKLSRRRLAIALSLLLGPTVSAWAQEPWPPVDGETIVFRPQPWDRAASPFHDAEGSTPLELDLAVSAGPSGVEITIANQGGATVSVQPALEAGASSWAGEAREVTVGAERRWTVDLRLALEIGDTVALSARVASIGERERSVGETFVWDGSAFSPPSRTDWASVAPEAEAFARRLAGRFEASQIGTPIGLRSVSEHFPSEVAAGAGDAAGYRFCLDLGQRPIFQVDPGGIAYFDASPQGSGPFGDTVDWGEDFGRIDEPHPAVHVLALIEDAGTGEPVWGPGFLSDEGCTEELIDLTGDAFNLGFGFWSRRPDGSVQMATFECTDEECTFPIGVVTEIERPAEPQTIKVYQGSSLNVLASIHWAGYFTLQTWLPSDLGVAFVLAKQPSGGPAASNMSSGLPTSNFPGVSGRRKYTVAHEVAHLISAFRLMPDLEPEELDYGYAGNVSHGLDTREWQPVAAFEGLADFAAVHTWFAHGAEEPLYVERASSSTDPALAKTWNLAKTWRWLELHSGECQPAWLSGLVCPAGVGVELDWAAALRAFYAGRPASEELHLALMGLLPHARPEMVVPQLYYPAFLLGVEAELGVAAREDFAQVGATYGIDH